MLKSSGVTVDHMMEYIKAHATDYVKATYLAPHGMTSRLKMYFLNDIKLIRGFDENRPRHGIFDFTLNEATITERNTLLRLCCSPETHDFPSYFEALVEAIFRQ